MKQNINIINNLNKNLNNKNLNNNTNKINYSPKHLEHLKSQEAEPISIKYNDQNQNPGQVNLLGNNADGQFTISLSETQSIFKSIPSLNKNNTKDVKIIPENLFINEDEHEDDEDYEWNKFPNNDVIIEARESKEITMIKKESNEDKNNLNQSEKNLTNSISELVDSTFINKSSSSPITKSYKFNLDLLTNNAEVLEGKNSLPNTTVPEKKKDTKTRIQYEVKNR